MDISSLTESSVEHPLILPKGHHITTLIIEDTEPYELRRFKRQLFPVMPRERDGLQEMGEMTGRRMKIEVQGEEDAKPARWRVGGTSHKAKGGFVLNL